MKKLDRTELEFFASCPKGLEYLLRDELRELGAEDAQEGLAGVKFTGDFILGLKACLHSRLASRVMHVLSRFQIEDADSIYFAAAKLPWTEWVGTQKSIAVDVSGSAQGVSHTHFAALRVKDAVVDAHRAAGIPRPTVATDRPDVQLRLFLHPKNAALMWDLSGESLHQRGWRGLQGEAPIKENLAAAMLLRSNWPARAAAGEILIDPMCGAGTVLLEGVAMAADVASGLLRAERDEFGFYQHPLFLQDQWKALVEDAKQRADAGKKALGLTPRFIGFDADATLLSISKRNSQTAGFAGFIQLQQARAESISKPEHAQAGLIISNPPYGERMGKVRELLPLYAKLGEHVSRHFPGFGLSLISSDNELLNAVGLPISKRYQLKNGALDCQLALFDTSRVFRQKTAPGPVLSEGSQMVWNRLEKNQQRLKQYVSEQQLQAYRIYDADLPEYSAAIDVYDQRLHIQEYLAPKDVPEEVAEKRLQELVQAAQKFFAVQSDQIKLKTRRREKGGGKYRRREEKTGDYFKVQEGPATFWINLDDYLDSGLFLDSRVLRQRIGKHCKHFEQVRFLNLFCYTATATVYAALNGAESSVSIDLSPNYIHWASQNFELNGVDPTKHRLVADDALQWLENAARGNKGSFDLIYLDPPTFSNSKRTDSVLDIQRDHAWLIEQAMELLAPDGELIFVCNAQRFKLDEAVSTRYKVQTLSPKSVPPDYARNLKIHSAFAIRAT